jgi:hypothetical protein
MVLFAAAAIAALAPQAAGRTAAPAVQATATVRIVSGVRLALGKTRAGDGFKVRDTIFRSAGFSQAARLIEFE